MPIPDSPDAALQLKKRARRRLVGAVAFAGLAAVVLPMVMDEEPRPPVQDVQIRIPGENQTPFEPKIAKVPSGAEKPEKAENVAEKPPEKPAEKPPEKPAAKKPEAKPEPKPEPKPAEKAPPKAPEKPAARPAENDAQRAQAILDGKTPPAPVASNGGGNGGQYVILIGAFSNPANVKQLQNKIGEMNIRVYTEALDAPGGKKTRVRAGPFPSREAADKALEKIRRIGVNGVVAARQ